ncbi:MAG: oxidoreductase [Sphingomonas adhaesiva]|uniref:oxidoreductase n=1 Tax=Sphingomonas adhaesiva TaxID=28212 RepID=UPI002FF6BAD0
MEDRIGVGLVGYGYAGRTFHAALIAGVTALDLRAVVSRRADEVRRDWPAVTVHADIDAMLADPAIGLVVVATPNDTHAPLACAALRAGRHVVVDKPFALDLAQARAVIEVAEAAGRQLFVFHNRRWDSDFLTISAAIAEGVIGEVRHWESHFDRFRPAVRDRWREHDAPGAGVWFDLGPHLIDQALLLFGLPDGVLASLARQRDGAAVDDWAHVVLLYGERRVVLHAGSLVAGGTHRFVAHGTRGSLVKHGADRQEAQLVAGARAGGAGWGEDPDPLIVIDSEGEKRERAAVPGDQRAFYRAVAGAIAGQATSPVHPVEALAVMAVLIAAQTSAREGRVCAPDLLADERNRWEQRGVTP